MKQVELIVANVLLLGLAGLLAWGAKISLKKKLYWSAADQVLLASTGVAFIVLQDIGWPKGSWTIYLVGLTVFTATTIAGIVKSS